ncbi:MAG TPA: hypothetical protein VF476_09635 [Chitinophagaceae bacterium]
MKRSILLAATFMLLSLIVAGQDEEEDDKKGGFKKENLFTGGSISLAFYNNTFLVGASPVFGYSITNWADLGLVVNYNYTSYRDYNYVTNDKLRQTVYGGGAFLKLYPVRFLFVQAQFEHNFIRQKFIPEVGITQKYKDDVSSFLVGGGYTSGRQGRGGQPFFYLAVLFDVSGNKNSPYTDNLGRTIPIVRGGLQVPLFQGGGRER